ncbi:Eukaryotic translation initiation factor 1b [Chytriomyces hyalinus]|nr:Eukaryotic translation initiation factor 1b [Chytriomyces hyalinus]
MTLLRMCLTSRRLMPPNASLAPSLQAIVRSQSAPASLLPMVSSHRHHLSSTSQAPASPQPPPQLPSQPIAIVSKKPPSRLPRKAALILTPSAVTRLKQLFSDPNNPQLLKVGTRKKGCSGQTYNLEYVTTTPGKMDEIVEQDGVKVLIESKALFSLIGSEMDFVEDDLSSTFVFNNPNVKEMCGLIAKDPFADIGDGDDIGDVQQGYIHVRIQQRNGRKTLTTVQGLAAEIDPKKVLKAFKKQFACNGNIIEDEEHGECIQLQGDQRTKVLQFLTEQEISSKEKIKIHGF